MAEQTQSRHALALKAYDGEGFAGRTLRERSGLVYAFDAQGVRIRQNEASQFFPIQWLFGSGKFARTPVFQHEGRWVEQRLSWYSETQKLGLTPGHSFTPASSLESAMGVVQSERNAARCFACHQTNERPGVHCESCHGAQDEHPNKATIRRDRSVAACAQCHRSPVREYSSPAPELEDPLSIRFAPVGLLASRCYQQSQGKLDCVTCHNPHQNAATGAEPYDAACRNCHASAAKTPCPRTPGCANCHMPRSSPAPLLTFTDHRIRRP